MIWTYGWVGLSTDAGTTTTVHWVRDLLQVKLGSGLEVRLEGLVLGALSSSAGAFFPRGGTRFVNVRRERLSTMERLSTARLVTHTGTLPSVR